MLPIRAEPDEAMLAQRTSMLQRLRALEAARPPSSLLTLALRGPPPPLGACSVAAVTAAAHAVTTSRGPIARRG